MLVHVAREWIRARAHREQSGLYLLSKRLLATFSVSENHDRVIASPSASSFDHEELRRCTLVFRKYIKGEEALKSHRHEGDTSQQAFQPSAASQMCQTMAFGYSLFFKNTNIDSDGLERAITKLATELPPLSGRVRPPSGKPGMRPLSQTVIDLSNCGIEFVRAETQRHTIEDLGPHTWLTGMSSKELSSFGVPFYTEPFDTSEMYRGGEPLIKFKLTRCIDGQIVSATVSHLLADAGRALRLMERLSRLYRAEIEGIDPGPPCQFNPELETAHGLAAALENAPPKWDPPAVDYHLSILEKLAAPYHFIKSTRQKYDVVMIYLPNQCIQRLKSISNEYKPSSSAQVIISKTDAVQAFIATLTAGLRKSNNLVPIYPKELTVNVDLLHKQMQFSNPKSIDSHVGNAVHILHVPGYLAKDDSAKNTSIPRQILPDDTADEIKRKLTQAIGMNAVLIRRAISTFRYNVSHVLQALQRQENMVDIPEINVAAAFLVKGATMKVASTTAVNSFSFNGIDFGSGPAHYAQINYQPRFDWWTIIQDAQGYGKHPGGVLCTMTFEAGLADDFVRHPVWEHVLPEARLFVPHPDSAMHPVL